MKLSIITINYNNLEGLRKTIDSVVSQTWRDFEWIVVDGGSTDGSRELIEEYAAKGCFAWWCSEPDKGIYNAMNKGITHANGEYLNFLNSGDSFADKNVVQDFYIIKRTEDIISGNIIIDGNIDILRENPSLNQLDYEYMCNRTILHPSSFVKKELFVKYGFFDESLRIVSDWKFFLITLIQYSCSYYKWNRVITDFNSGGISESSEYNELIRAERKKVLDEFLVYVQKTIKEKNDIIQKQQVPLKEAIKQRFFEKLKKSIHIINAKTYYLYSKALSLYSVIYRNSNEEEKIIVSMTSWRKRIDNVYNTIKSILENETRPDKIVLNLSKEEFPGKEKELPDDLLNLQRESLIEIFWVEGNTKAFKKIIPTLTRFPKDIIIAIDDDFIYPPYFIETFMEMHNRYPKNPLCGNDIYIQGVLAHCGCASLVKKEFFGKYLDELLDDTIIKIGMDDIFYTYCAALNGYNYRYAGRRFFYNMVPNNPYFGLSDTSAYSNEDMRSYLNAKIKKEYHLDFDLLNEPVFAF